MFQLRPSFFSSSVCFGLLLAGCAYGQTISSLTPSSVSAGSASFVLSVFGDNFSPSSVVELSSASGTAVSLPTYVVNSTLIIAVVPASDVASGGTLSVDVAGGSSPSNQISLPVIGSGSSSSGSGSGSSGSGSSSSGSGSSGSGSSSSGSSSSGSGSSSSGSGGGSGCYGCYSTGSGSSSGSGSGSSSGSSSGSGSGSGSGSSSGSGGSTTSPSGSPLLVTVTSPSANQSVNGSVSINASAAQTSNTDGSVASWGVYDGSDLLWVDENPDPSISVDLALSQGSHSIKVVAYDDSYTASTATVPVSVTASGLTTSWNACMYTSNGNQYQAMQISPGQQLTGVLQSEMFYGSNCNPTQWTDQLNDYGQTMSFGAGSSYIYWFIHRANTPGVSAVWTMGNQSSGCVNYAAVPACN